MMRNACLFALGASLAACTGGFGGGGPDASLPDAGPLADGSVPVERESLSCPVDPDCAIGGDCSLYVCPEFWVCETRASGTKRCFSPGPEYPDEGGGWECHDANGVTTCEGSDFPDDGGGDGWDCTQGEEFVTCTNDGADYPDEGGGGPWTCWYEADLRVCDNAPRDYPDDGGWQCSTTDDGVTTCRSNTPHIPDGGGFICFELEGEAHCNGGNSIPDGGDWECVETSNRYNCTDRTPDYPDGGGDETWNCRYDDEFRVCDDGGDDGGEGRRDCAVDDPSCGRPICEGSARGEVLFLDNEDGDDNGEVFVFGDGRRDQSCGTVRVEVTGYYTMFDSALAESCNSQRDEISYVTVTNSCNSEGFPVERNVGERYVIGDVDNTPSCSDDNQCNAGSTCQRRSAGRCCVPAEPALIGTFLLLAGQDNRICVNHFCPEYRDGAQGGDAFVSSDDCRGSIDSVHLRLDGDAFICPDESITLPAGCNP